MAIQAPSHAECHQAVRAANDPLTENVTLRSRIGDLEEHLRAVELTPAGVVDVGTLELTRLAHHYHRMLTVVIAELRARDLGIAEEVVAPRIRALEEELAEAKVDAWQAHQRVRDLEQECRRLKTALAAARVTPDQVAS
jgi:hypothetical protein